MWRDRVYRALPQRPDDASDYGYAQRILGLAEIKTTPTPEDVLLLAEVTHTPGIDALRTFGYRERAEAIERFLRAERTRQRDDLLPPLPPRPVVG